MIVGSFYTKELSRKVACEETSSLYGIEDNTEI